METISNENEQKSVESKTNAMAGKTYSLESTRGVYMNFGTGKSVSQVTADNERMTIQMAPAKKNMIPVICFSEIAGVVVNSKMSIYYAMFAILSLVACVESPAFLILTAFFIWAGLNKKITICMKSGNKAILYSHSKKATSDFVNDLKSVIGQ